jgi:hypothetical protein
MTRLGSLVLCATLGAGLLACGSDGTSTGTPKDPLDLVPLDNTVSGWTVDPDNHKTAGKVAAIGVGETGTEALIDGGAENYFQEPNVPTTFVWQNYVNSTLSAAPDGATVKLYIFEMPSADQAKGIYTAILQRPSHAARTGMPGDWEPTTPPVGTESRIQDTASQWWVNFYKSVFYVEVLLDPSYGPPPDYTPANADTKQEAVRFAQVVASKI